MGDHVKIFVGTLLAATAGFAALLLSNDTFAQETLIEEIVVTATKRETALSDTPISIAALDADTLEARAAVNFNDLLKLTPSAAFSQGFNPISNQISFRGIPSATAADGTVAVYVDDSPFAVLGLGVTPAMGLFDLARVEVLRGPQGTLWGQGSMGGTMRLITAEPDSTKFSAKVRASYADISDGDDSTTGDLMLNIPLLEDKLAARFVYSKSNLGGFVDDPGLPGLIPSDDDINDGEYEDIRVKLSFTPTDNLSLRYMYWLSQQEIQASNQVNLGSDPEDLLYSRFGGGGPVEAEFELHSLTVDLDFESFTLTNNLSSLDYEQPNTSNIPGFLSGIADFPSDGITNEIRLSSNGNGPWNWIIGHYYRDSDGAQVLDFSFFLLLGGPFLNVLELESETNSFFGEVSREFADGLVEVLVGVRVFEDKREFQDLIFGFPVSAFDEEFDSTNPRFNISLRPNDNAMYYFNYAEGFRSGVFVSGAGQAVAAAAGFTADIIEPDSVKTIEIGGKWTLRDGAMNLEGAVYFSDWEDAQLQPLGPGGFPLPLNVGDAEIRGIDLALTTSTGIDGLTLGLTASYIDSEYTSVNPGIAVLAAGGGFTSTIAEGESVGAVPDLSATLSLDYMGPSFANGTHIFVNSSYSYRDEQNDLSGFPAKADSFEDVSLRIGLEKPESWKVTLFGQNLTNDIGVLSSSYGAFIGVTRPREVGLSVEFEL